MASMILLILAVNLLVGTVLTSPFIINAPSTSDLARQSDVGYRLNSEVIPTAYIVTITPSFDTGDADAFTFEGQVQITVRTQVTGLTQVKLHSRDLNFTSEDITVVSTYNVQIPLATTNPLEFEAAYDFVTIHLSSALVVNIDYTIQITYRGPIRDDMTGFYRSSYLEDGVTKWLGITQFEPVYARRVFPSFDEPAYKATFTFVINRPESYQPTLANTKLEKTSSPLNGRVTETFYPSPVMPTYLGAILVSEFESGAYTTDASGYELGIWSRPQAKNQSAYAHEIALKLLDGFNELVGINYYSTETLSKLDHLAIPDFSAGAMENWGLVTYRESYIMWDPSDSNSLNKQSLAGIISHETAHMWFGNLVTCHWWSDIWLNEGHARYFQYYITHLVEPSLDMENAFVTGAVQAAFSSDQVASAPALTNDEVNSPSEISGHFGTISYSKGASVIRMIHHWIGNDAFSFGLNSYLTTQKFTVSEPADLYAGLQRGADNYLSLVNYSGFTVADVMSRWVTQAGFPLVQVDVNYETNIVTLTQNRFYVNGSLRSDEIYAIPITYVTKADPDYENTKPAFVFNTQTYSFNVVDLDNSYIIFNKQVTGYYRVNYDSNTWNKIIEVLQSSERTTIHKINRAQIVDDTFALLSAEIISTDFAFKILDFLSQENDYYVWASAISGYNSLRRRFKASDPNSVKLTTYILNQLSKVMSELGYVDNEIEDHPTRKNRMQILDFACTLGHEACFTNAATALTTFRTGDVKIAPNLRPFAYCYGLASGNEADYDFLLNLYHSANVISDRLVMERALGCTGVESRIHNYLALAISENSPIRDQDLSSVVGNVIKIRNNVPVVLQYVKDNYADFGTRYSSGASVINSLASAMTTDEDLNSLENWVPTCTACTDSEKARISSTIQSTRSRFDWSEERSDELTSMLDSVLATPTEPNATEPQGNGASKPTTVLSFMLIVLIIVILL